MKLTALELQALKEKKQLHSDWESHLICRLIEEHQALQEEVQHLRSSLHTIHDQVGFYPMEEGLTVVDVVRRVDKMIIQTLQKRG